ncbi:MAG TPA: nucleotidyltransferase [Bacteroidetes bacterium]|nr:nucleotidyltransferase [Bacteroidota bacterium]
MKPVLLVLAAGMGSRYGGLKQIDKVGPGGEAIIDYSIYDAIRAGYSRIVFVIRKDIETDIRNFFEPRLKGRIPFDFVHQELDMIPEGFSVPPDRKKPWGTGHAVMVASSKIDQPFAVINGDDFYGPSSYRQTADFLMYNSDPNEYAMVGYRLDNTLSDNGSVARGICKTNDHDYLEEVTEHTKIYREDGKIISLLDDGTRMEFTGDEPVSMNFWCFKPGIFPKLESQFTTFLREHGNEPKSEFFIPLPVTTLIRSGEIKMKVLHSREAWFGVTYKEDKPVVEKKIRDLVDAGVYPEKLWE